MKYNKELFPEEVTNAYEKFMKYLDIFQRVYNGEIITEETVGTDVYKVYGDCTLTQFVALLSWAADDLEDEINRWEYPDDDDWDDWDGED